MPELVGEAYTRQLRVSIVERKLASQRAAAADIADETVQHTFASRSDDQCADRHLAAALERGEKGPLRVRVGMGARVVERGDDRADVRVVVANLHGDGALPRGGQPRGRIEVRGDVLRNAEAVQARQRRESRRVRGRRPPS